MNTLIALALKITGLGALWNKLNGYKTKLGAVGLMLAGLGMVLTGVSLFIATLVACPDQACQVGLFRGITDSEGVALALKGAVVFKGGLLGLGLGHKLEKAAPAPVAAPDAAAE